MSKTLMDSAWGLSFIAMYTEGDKEGAKMEVVINGSKGWVVSNGRRVEELTSCDLDPYLQAKLLYPNVLNYVPIYHKAEEYDA